MQVFFYSNRIDYWHTYMYHLTLNISAYFIHKNWQTNNTFGSNPKKQKWNNDARCNVFYSNGTYHRHTWICHNYFVVDSTQSCCSLQCFFSYFASPSSSATPIPTTVPRWSRRNTRSVLTLKFTSINSTSTIHVRLMCVLYDYDIHVMWIS